MQLVESKLNKIISELEGDITKTNEQDLMEIRDEISEHIATNQEKDKSYFDKKRCAPVKYQEGDLVRVERQVPSTGHSRKLIPKFQGPYRIKKVLDHDRYHVEDTPLTKKGGRGYSATVAVDKLKSWLNFNRPHDSENDLSNESD